MSPRIAGRSTRHGHFLGASHTPGEILTSLNLHMGDNQRIVTILKAILLVGTIRPKGRAADSVWKKQSSFMRTWADPALRQLCEIWFVLPYFGSADQSHQVAKPGWNSPGDSMVSTALSGRAGFLPGSRLFCIWGAGPIYFRGFRSSPDLCDQDKCLQMLPKVPLCIGGRGGMWKSPPSPFSLRSTVLIYLTPA